MKKFGVLLCVMLCVPMFAFKANNEGKLLLFFESAATGEEVCQYVMAQNLLPSISLEQLRQSVFHLIMQGLYMNKTLDLS